MTQDTRLKKMILTALLAALSCAATISIRIPVPATGGYIHPGDAVVILSGILLGPVWGFLAGGIGSALADFLGGYLIYVPITLIIKGLIAMVSGFIFLRMKKTPKTRSAAVILGGLSDIVLVSGGYFLCESFIYGTKAASASIPANLIQGTGGLVIACILYPVMAKSLIPCNSRYNPEPPQVHP